MTEMVQTRINGRWNIILPKHRADRPEWDILNGGWERARLDSMYANTMSNDVVYYVGAEEGDMCGLVAKWGGHLVMFEPNERVLPNLREIWKANDLKQCAVFTGFASNQTTDNWRDSLTTDISGIEGEVISDHGFRELHEPGQIAQVKIDDISKELPPPNMITMDVEGSEWEVLQGAEKTIKEHKPLIYLSLHPEFLFRIYDKYSYEVRRWIIDLGYEEKLLDYQHECHFVYWPKGTELNV